MYIGERYIITSEGHAAGYRKCPRTIQSIDRLQIVYRTDEGDVYDRPQGEVTLAIARGHWAKMYPQHLALPRGA